ncbi:MAG: Transposase [Planctomycetaceae bacterium]|nr:Transposase [Planctomycetaceae bacterium]
MSQTRRRFDAEQKAQIVRRHPSGKEPVSKLAEEFDIQPSQIHTWVNLVLAQAEKAFERSSNSQNTNHQKDRQIKQLQAKLIVKNEVVAELMEANVLAKKVFGEL